MQFWRLISRWVFWSLFCELELIFGIHGNWKPIGHIADLAKKLTQHFGRAFCWTCKRMVVKKLGRVIFPSSQIMTHVRAKCCVLYKKHNHASHTFYHFCWNNRIASKSSKQQRIVICVPTFPQAIYSLFLTVSTLIHIFPFHCQHFSALCLCPINCWVMFSFRLVWPKVRHGTRGALLKTTVWKLDILQQNWCILAKCEAQPKAQQKIVAKTNCAYGHHCHRLWIVFPWFFVFEYMQMQKQTKVCVTSTILTTNVTLRVHALF